MSCFRTESGDFLADERQAKGTNPPVCASVALSSGGRATVGQRRRLSVVPPRLEFGQLVIELKVDYNKVISRSVGRRQPPCCSALRDLAAIPLNAPGNPDRHSDAFVTRCDRREYGARGRLETRRKSPRRLLVFHAAPGRLCGEVDDRNASAVQPGGRMSGRMVLE